MLYDKEFLRKLDENRTRTIYARIIALTLDETPIEAIEGRVTQGSVNIDGDSAVRRTCSLTIAAQGFDYNAFIWGLNTKFKLEIGVENIIDSSYPNIIWFKQGTYFISSFNTSHSANDLNISIQGKDKMCALNGEIGGTLTSSVDFGTIEDIITANGKKSKVITKLNVKDIIRNAVHLYGGEPLHNIIINDLDITGLELLEYRYDVPMYLYRKAEANSAFENVTLDGNKKCKLKTNLEAEITLKDLTSAQLEMLVNPMTGTSKPEIIIIENNEYYVAKVSYGETAGYRFTDLTYPGDLIGGIGEAITSILDKIKNMLGDFEYFYDLDGHFVFQRKQNSLKTLWEPGEEIAEINQESDVAYTFKGGLLVTTFNNNPNLANLKNDYSVWGEKIGISGKAVPVHMRYAIDLKPTSYKSFDGIEYKIDNYDWRELIYQMAKDYYKHSGEEDFAMRLAEMNFPNYPTGKTGYESYYQDLQGFWRDIYNPDASDGFYPKGHSHEYWSKTVYEAPQSLNFWFDFLDADNNLLSQYSVKNIGCRPKAINDSNVKAIYFRETPSIVFTENYEMDSAASSAYTYINANKVGMKTMFSISAQGKSAKAAVDDLLYQHGYCIESTTINTVPIYYLEPNSRIHVLDEKSKIDGYYNISKLSIPLTYNGTMSITATKAVENI